MITTKESGTDQSFVNLLADLLTNHEIPRLVKSIFQKSDALDVPIFSSVYLQSSFASKEDGGYLAEIITEMIRNTDNNDSRYNYIVDNIINITLGINDPELIHKLITRLIKPADKDKTKRRLLTDIVNQIYTNHTPIWNNSLLPMFINSLPEKEGPFAAEHKNMAYNPVYELFNNVVRSHYADPVFYALLRQEKSAMWIRFNNMSPALLLHENESDPLPVHNYAMSENGRYSRVPEIRLIAYKLAKFYSKCSCQCDCGFLFNYTRLINEINEIYSLLQAIFRDEDICTIIRSHGTPPFSGNRYEELLQELLEVTDLFTENHGSLLNP